MRPLSAVLFLLVLVQARAQESSTSLDEGWSVSRAGHDERYPAHVPGCVQNDLLSNGLIPDFHQGANIDDVQWIEREDWVYRKSFAVEPALFKSDHIELIFKGLDGFAEIRFNDSLLGIADNMFRTWEWDIGKLVREGSNDLEVRFLSTYREGKERKESYGIELPHDSDSSGISPFVRKAAYQFGWDFCPRLVTMGLWKGVELRAWSLGRIAGAKASWSGDVLSIDPELYVDPRVRRRARLRAELNDVVLGEAPIAELSRLTVRVPEEVLPRWMPAGMGYHRVGRLKLLLELGYSLISEYERPIGRASNFLVQESDSIGRSFRFEAFGEAFFAKGCNIVPPDLVISDITDDAWVALVRDMQDAGMNMARIWAGGVYPPESFFNACDTAGILVWQDFMVANLVPSVGEFHENLRIEAKEQATRIAHHPCLAVFCGNNELRVAWHNWGWQSRYDLHGADSAHVIDANERLWTADLDRIVMELVGDGHYVPTSPLSNWGNQAGLLVGDLHYWGVWHGDSTFSSFDRNVGRFMSEWGFQSYPDSATLAAFHVPDSLRLGSRTIVDMQRSYKGDAPIWREASLLSGFPAPTTLGGFIETSQQLQSMAYGRALRAHLQSWPHCAGTLLWQLNDCWPGPSWSIIDYLGNRKPAFDAVRAAFLSKQGE